MGSNYDLGQFQSLYGRLLHQKQQGHLSGSETLYSSQVRLVESILCLKTLQLLQRKD